MLQKKVRVGKLGHQLKLRIPVKAREIIDGVVEQANQVRLGLVIERRTRNPFRRLLGFLHQLVGAKNFLGKKESLAQPAVVVPRAVIIGFEFLRIDAKIKHQLFHNRAEIARRLQGLRAAVAQQKFAVGGGELVALGMAAEIIVIVENEDARVFALLLAVEIGRRQAADASTHHNEVIRVARFANRPRLVPKILVANGMHDFERTIMLATQARQRRGIICFSSLRISAECQASNRQCRAIEKVASRNGAVHAKAFVIGVHAVVLSQAASRLT